MTGGDRAFPKERVEVFGGGKVAVIEDFRRVECWCGGKHRRLLKGKQDKGHGAEIDAFLRALQTGGPGPISWHELRAVTLASILAVHSWREGRPLTVDATADPAAAREQRRAS